MPLILNIDTALESASICLAKDGVAINNSSNPEQKDHAAWLQPAISKMLKASNVDVKDLDAIAVSIGPGSYTGLRVGLSSAKGLCYALHIPLVTLRTLEIMAYAAKNQDVDLLCPMIDARRMEVFTAVYTHSLQEIMPAQALILEHNSFSNLLTSNKILFFGNGSIKFAGLQNHDNAVFRQIHFDAASMSSMSFNGFLLQKFTDLTYSEPSYLKDFFHRAVRH
ncbi:MAG: tRNA (adenosine(37)-N6)-threonylcarbamoyltransferase complex dimerization subunit type 1 TsaB [Bacteroidetes bacterium]|nr:tRNA (adenosine(37)-N6)-threonylcarbamoyltransferase complex dimerization subunit type 1 TsaB [Bacteroidota bacterium]MBS1632223.1 tRNA (adenosine(37)-N6)-threonylcarbamoyltransferase complex dimerization subunit type 1 TsaB [Bacteroidota bacterium]